LGVDTWPSGPCKPTLGSLRLLIEAEHIGYWPVLRPIILSKRGEVKHEVNAPPRQDDEKEQR
jgi:hypothetical protein